MSDNESEEELATISFDLPLPTRGPTTNLTARHDKIADLLHISRRRVKHDDVINDSDEEEESEEEGGGEDYTEMDDLPLFIFKTIASLCDPFTQPEESNECILSVDCISDLVIAISYKSYIQRNESAKDLLIESIRFDISTILFELLRKIHVLLNAEDELKLRFVNNDEKHYLENLHEWTPKTTISNNDYNLRLLYSIACVIILTMYKLFIPKKGDYNLTLNPYLHYFLKLWKSHTNIILLGLEIDRRIEFQNHEKGSLEETPSIVQQTLKGSSSIRYVLAWILNQNPSSTPILDEEKDDTGTSFTAGAYRFDDNPSINEEQAGRRLNQSKKLAELGDILIDLEYADRFDEDIKYMLEYEYEEDAEEEDDEVEDAPEGDNIDEVKEPETDDPIPSEIGEGLAIPGLEFDEFGRDWRDIPRGENAEFNNLYLTRFNQFDKLTNKGDSDDFFVTWNELYETFEFLNTNSIEGNSDAELKIGQAVINTISKSIKDSIEKKDSPITPNKIYQYWTSSASVESIRITQEENNKMIVPIFNVTKFELFLHNNSQLARSAMDEMLMCEGYRRLLIWFITHNLNLSILLIDYVYQLLAGLRGSKDSATPYVFSRMGDKLLLSDIEQSMLLHEFLTNSNVYLSATNGIEIEDGYQVVLAESIAKKLMSLLCIMINHFIKLGIINLNETTDDDIHDYNNELQVLLINWIGKVPEARQLYFKIKNATYDDNTTVVAGETVSPNNDNLTDVSKKDELAFLRHCEGKSLFEISEELDTNPKQKQIVKGFANRMEKHLEAVLNQDKSSADLQEIGDDFRFFIDNFNTLCKIEYLAEILFEKFEPVITSGSISELGAKVESEEFFEAEFNTDFLHGEGKFEEKEEEKKPSSSSKKKAKKKKKSKKK
ncbi:hypothetical protein SBY92_004977 [Candida maltosa Xu316]